MKKFNKNLFVGITIALFIAAPIFTSLSSSSAQALSQTFTRPLKQTATCWVWVICGWGSSKPTTPPKATTKPCKDCGILGAKLELPTTSLTDAQKDKVQGLLKKDIAKADAKAKELNAALNQAEAAYEAAKARCKAANDRCNYVATARYKFNDAREALAKQNVRADQAVVALASFRALEGKQEYQKALKEYENAKTDSLKRAAYLKLSLALGAYNKANDQLSGAKSQLRKSQYTLNDLYGQGTVDPKPPVRRTADRSSAISTISRTDCGLLGRYYISGSGCARNPSQKSLVDNSGVCANPADIYVVAEPNDYCKSGDSSIDKARKALAESGAVKQRPVTAPIEDDFSNLGPSGDPTKPLPGYQYGAGSTGPSGCVRYVNNRLAAWGITRLTSSEPGSEGTGNGKTIVNILNQSRGWTKTAAPRAGAVFSNTGEGGGAGHTGIVRAVLPNGNIIVEDNYEGSEGTHEYTKANLRPYDKDTNPQGLGFSFAIRP